MLELFLEQPWPTGLIKTGQLSMSLGKLARNGHKPRRPDFVNTPLSSPYPSLSSS